MGGGGGGRGGPAAVSCHGQLSLFGFGLKFGLLSFVWHSVRMCAHACRKRVSAVCMALSFEHWKGKRGVHMQLLPICGRMN